MILLGISRRQFSSSIRLGKDRVGLLKYVDMALERDGRIGGGLITHLLKKARNAREVRDLIQESKTRFGNVPWQTYSAAAYICAGREIDDPQMAGDMLQELRHSGHLSNVNEGVMRAVLGNASRNKNSAVALNVFDVLKERSLVSFSDYARVLHSEPGPVVEVDLINEVLKRQCLPDIDVRLIGVMLKSCAQRHDFELAQKIWLWSEPRLNSRHGDSDLTFIAVQFLLLCGRTGNLNHAKDVWKQCQTIGISSQKEVVGAMMSAFAVTGSADEVTRFLQNEIVIQDINKHILVSALTAYSHTGQTQHALKLVETVEQNQKNIIDIQVYTALIDGFARKGEFNIALELVQKVKKRGLSPDAVLWMTILSPCRHFKNLDVATEAFNHIEKLGDEETRASAHVLLADVYKACGDDVASERLQQERRDKNLRKSRGAVTLQIGNENFVFYVGQVPQELENHRADILEKIDEWTVWLASQGTNTESLKCLHSEKLALAYAVLRKQKQITMRKNLRICSLCHAASIELTKLENITIHHWDRSRVHIMENGKCSCNNHY